MKTFLTLLSLSLTLFAMPAIDSELNFKQKDGSSFYGHLKGDAYFNWVETQGGYITKYNAETKNYEYMILDENGELVSSHIKVITKTGAKKSARFSSKSASKEQNTSTLPSYIKKIPKSKMGELRKKQWKKFHPLHP